MKRDQLEPLLYEAFSNLDKSAGPFDLACTQVRQAHDIALAQNRYLKELEKNAGELLAVLRQALNWDAPPPAASHTRDLMAACRKLSATLKST